jgi:hypothetical protein
MAKIGGSSGGLAPKAGSGGFGGAPKDPFIGLEHSILGEDGTPKGHSWGVMTRAVTTGLGQSWFQEFSTMPIPDWVAREAPSKFMAKSRIEPDTSGSSVKLVEAMVGQLSWYQEGVVFPELLRQSEDIGTPTLFSQSSLAPKILKFFGDRGVSGEEIPILAMGSNIAEIGETTMWVGGWATSFGTRTNTWFEIRKSEDGTESACFHTNLAISTRVPDRWLSEVFSIPAQAHALLYTAETQFPTSIMTMSRSMTWRDVPADVIPTPFLAFERNGLCCVNFGDSGQGQIQTDFAGYPVVLSAGYLIPESSEEHFDEIIPIVVDTLTNLASIVEDGFRNYRNATTPVSFDHVLGSEYVIMPEDSIEEGVSTGGYARWVPETHLGELVKVSRERYQQACQMPTGPEAKALLDWVVAEGAGAVVGGAINSLVYSYLLPGRDFERAERLLKRAIAMEILYESPNAQANLGQVYLAQNRRDEARAVFEAAAAQEWDKFAVSEASYFLGLMAMEDGDRDEAQAHFTKGANEEADNTGTHRQLCREKLAQEFS